MTITKQTRKLLSIRNTMRKLCKHCSRLYSRAIARIIIKLVQHRLHVPDYVPFRFANQRTDDVYWFDGKRLHKMLAHGENMMSGVSLNYIISDECKIVRGIE